MKPAITLSIAFLNKLDFGGPGRFFYLAAVGLTRSAVGAAPVGMRPLHRQRAAGWGW